MTSKEGKDTATQLEKKNWKWHKQDHKYGEEGHIKLIDSKRKVI